MNRVILNVIRHGKTKCNEQRLYCGKSDVSLSENGVKELIEVKQKVEYPKCNLNFTSGAKRANETFELLYDGVSYEKRFGFFEFDFGDFEMKSYDMLKENKDYIDWITDETKTVKCPNGESKIEFYIRITKALKELVEEIINNNEKEAVLICHGGVIGTILELFYKRSKDFYSMQPSCGRGYRLEVKVDKDIEINILGEI